MAKAYSPTVYAVGREKVREYAAAVGETNLLYFELDAARAAGYADVVAPPMFAVVYAGAAVVQGIFDPELGIDIAHLVHGAQEFRWGAPVVAGDEITTVASVAEVSERRELRFYVFETVSVNEREQTVCNGVWTNIVRAA